MISERRCIIHPTPGFSAQVGHLVAMMEQTRSRTIDVVQDLTVEQFDYLHDEQSNSIGALLLHIAAVEVLQQTWSFDNRSLDERDHQTWRVALELGENARKEICGHTAAVYIDRLRAVRARTIEELRRRDDKWLYEEIPSRSMNQYFRWFHVLEDEISHRGQIKWLLRRSTTQH